LLAVKNNHCFGNIGVAIQPQKYEFATPEGWTPEDSSGLKFFTILEKR